MEEFKKELHQRVQQKKEIWKQQREPLFHCPYIDSHGTLEAFLSSIRNVLEYDHYQTRCFVGVIQATLSGKTRLIIEASVHHPIILISFKRGNLAYWNTLLESIKKNEITCNSFEERQFHNNIIIMKVKLFILSFLDLAFLYKQDIMGNKKWKDADTESKHLLNSLLLNGGDNLVQKFFKKRLVELDEDSLDLSTVQARKASIDNEVNRILKELEYPWIAFDECHVLQYHCSGILFHPDYQTQYRVVPKGYPHKPTTLFSAFTWICEELLQQDTKTMSIFLTTHCSCWNSIFLDEPLYSRNEPRIQFFSSLPILGAQDVQRILTEFYKIDTKLLEYLGDGFLTVWEARPGYLLDIARFSLTRTPSTVKDLQEAIRAASAAAMEDIQDKFELIKSDIPLLHYLVAMHNGRTSNQGAIDRLVAAGIAIKGTDSAVLCEQLVLQRLQSLIPPSLDEMEKTMVNYIGSDYESLGKRAVALQLLRFSGSVADLLKLWGSQSNIPSNTLDVLDEFNVKFKAAGSFDEFRLGAADEAFDVSSPLWKDTILLAPTGFSLPNILCVAKHESGAHCLLSIQVMTWSDKPSPPSKEDPKGKTRITSLIQNVSRPHFFAGHNYLQTSFASRWKDCISKIGPICHLRILICWPGFTSLQCKLVDDFNQKHPSEPIVLAWPTELNNALYGYFPSIKLCEGVTNEPWKKLHRPMRMNSEMTQLFEEVAKMDLDSEELLLDVLDLYE